MNMSTYIAYWKRGWWAWLMVLTFNVSLAVVAIPLASAFAENQLVYWVSFTCIWLVLGSPYLGWLFESFAQNSQRLHSILPEEESSS